MACEVLKRSAVDVLVIIVGITIGVILGGIVFVGIGGDATGAVDVPFLNLHVDREWISLPSGILFSILAVWAIQSIRLKFRRKRRNAGSGA